MTSRRRRRADQEPPPQPIPPELTAAPELATVAILERALEVAMSALIAQHMTLIDDLHRPIDDGPVVCLADQVRRRAGALLQLLWRYRRAVRDSQAPAAHDPTEDNLF